MGGGVGLAYLLEQGVSFDTWRESRSLAEETGKRSAVENPLLSE
jgi:hypothetical protein